MCSTVEKNERVIAAFPLGLKLSVGMGMGMGNALGCYGTTLSTARAED